MRTALVLMAAIGCCVRDSQGQDRSNDLPLQESERRLCEVAGADEAVELLKSLPPAEQLIGAQEKSIAVFGAWELALSHVANRPEGTVKIPDFEAGKFVGFVEGRLALKVPRWWEENFRIRYTALDRNEVPFPESQVRQGQRFKGKYAVRASAGDWLYFKIPANYVKMREPGMGEVSHVSYVAHTDRVYLTEHAIIDTYPVLCFDRRNGALLWENMIWEACEPGNVSTGQPGPHSVDLVVQEGVVSVFGAAHSLYAVQFDAKTGKPRFRFTTFFGKHISRSEVKP